MVACFWWFSHASCSRCTHSVRVDICESKELLVQVTRILQRFAETHLIEQFLACLIYDKSKHFIGFQLLHIKIIQHEIVAFVICEKWNKTFFTYLQFIFVFQYIVSAVIISYMEYLSESNVNLLASLHVFVYAIF